MRLVKLTAALVAAGLAMPILAAPDPAMEKLVARLEKLEARNADLEKEVKALKGENEKVARGLDSPRLSENEPELTVRLKAVEKDTLAMKKAAKIAESLEGIKVGAALSTVAQQARGLPKSIEGGSSHLNYRADLTVEVPLAPIGDIEHKLFGHLRMGQGLGLNSAFTNLKHFSGAPNGVAFRASGANADDSVPVLGEAWYQASIPLPFGGFKPHSRESIEVTFGKVDFFGFFDQNAVAGDESKQFLNSVFVHNPLLDAGGETGVDANGFQPGFIAAYVNHSDKAQPWRLSFGVFGAGDRGANYQRTLSSPLLMLQAEKQLKLFGGLTGHYRLYGWTRSQGADFDGTLRRHSGYGLSVSQQVDDNLSLFARYGRMVQGELPFNQALTVGVEISGNAWGRAGDSLGIAGAWMKTGKAYRANPVTSYLDDAQTLAASTFSPQGAERLVELYYRFRLSPQFDLTPDFQWIARPGGNRDAKSVQVIGLRANIAY